MSKDTLCHERWTETPPTIGNRVWLCKAGVGRRSMNLFKNEEERTIQLVVTREDLEEVVRAVVSELLDEKEQERIALEQSRKDAKITRDVACKRLGKDQSTLFRWEKAGMLHAIKIGRSVYYLESEIRGIEEGRL